MLILQIAILALFAHTAHKLIQDTLEASKEERQPITFEDLLK
jgi:hypothetical protein